VIRVVANSERADEKFHECDKYVRNRFWTHVSRAGRKIRNQSTQQNGHDGTKEATGSSSVTELP
jgi:hypothetical protein